VTCSRILLFPGINTRSGNAGSGKGKQGCSNGSDTRQSIWRGDSEQQIEMWGETFQGVPCDFRLHKSAAGRVGGDRVDTERRTDL
jgi:hypothetical protein